MLDSTTYYVEHCVRIFETVVENGRTLSVRKKHDTLYNQVVDQKSDTIVHNVVTMMSTVVTHHASIIVVYGSALVLPKTFPSAPVDRTESVVYG